MDMYKNKKVTHYKYTHKLQLTVLPKSVHTSGQSTLIDPHQQLCLYQLENDTEKFKKMIWHPEALKLPTWFEQVTWRYAIVRSTAELRKL